MKNKLGAVLVMAGLALSVTALRAQSPASPASTDATDGVHGTFGPFTLDAGHAHWGAQQNSRLYGGVHINSSSYDLVAETMVFVPSSDKAGAATPFSSITAEGTPSKQIVGRFTDALNSQAYRILSDHAVYKPDTSRAGGGTVHFTGHVKVYATSGFLAGPSETTVGEATVILGQGKDYPQLDATDLHTEATPAK